MLSHIPPSSVSTLIAEAVRLLEHGDINGAEQIAKDLLARRNNADALHLLGIIRLQQNRPNEALVFLNRSLAVRPQNPHLLLNLAKVQRVINRAEDATKTLEAAIAMQPSLAEAWRELGVTMLQGRNVPAAECYLRKALELEPGNLETRLGLGTLLRFSDRNMEAEPLLADGLILSKDPKIKGAFAYNLAHAQYTQGKKDIALENFTLAAQLDQSLSADVNRADLLEEMLRMDEALAVLEELVRRQPDSAAAHAAYNGLLYRLGHDSEFLESYGRVPEVTDLQIAKAAFLLMTGRQQEASELYDRIAKRNPDHLDAAIGAATALNELGRPAEAIKHLERALSCHPNNAMIYQNLAANALQNRDPQKAAAMAEKSLLLSPVDQSGLALLGSAWRMMGDERDEMLNGYDDLIQVFDLPPPEGFTSMEEFNSSLNSWLEGRHPSTREPLMQSLRGGSQTRGFLFGQGHELIEKLRFRIEEAVTRYIAETKPDARHPFRGRCGNGFRFADSWSSRLKDNGFHINHVHPGGWISSCYYVTLPEVVKEEEQKQGWIKFGEPSFDAGLGIRRSVQPTPGRLILFPSYMWHGTIPFYQDAVRTTIAFDLVPGS